MSKIVQQLAAAKAKEAELVEESAPMSSAVKGSKKRKLTAEGGESGTAMDLRSRKKSVSQSCVIYLGHIPNGFFETQMNKFFSQFGEVKRLKLFRSLRTGNSKGYAFIEFEDASTAGVVAEAMNGYYLKERRLVCNVVPVEQQHDGMFKIKTSLIAKRSGGVGDKKNKISKDAVEESKDSIEADEKILLQVKNSLKAKTSKKQKKLSELGIEYEVPKFE